MARYTIRFDDKTMTKLETNAKENSVTITNYLRHLINLGLRIEQSSQQQNKSLGNEEMLKLLQIKSFQSIAETLLIVRRIVNFTNNSQMSTDDILKHVSDTAGDYIYHQFHREV